MKQEFRNLHNDMLKDLEKAMKLELPERGKVESCFWIAHNYWNKLKEFLNRRSFKDDHDEIEFFRNVKPRFTSYIEYMVLLSQALTCIPTEKDAEISYWKEEVERFKRFQQRNLEFVIYYECKRRHYDSIYFLRKNNKATAIIPAPVYDADPEFCTSHDCMIRAFLAYRMYSKYARKKLWEVTGRIRKSDRII